MHSQTQTLKRQAEDVSFNNDDLSDDKYEVTSPWGRKKSRYLYTYNLQSPDLFSINDSDQTESIDSIQSKATIEIADELNSVFETTSDSDYSECDDSYSQNSSQSDNSELEVAKRVSLFCSNDGYSADTDVQVIHEKSLLTPPFFKTCIQCTKENPDPHFQYCQTCFNDRKQWFDSKPDPKPKIIKKLITELRRSEALRSLKNSQECFGSQESAGSFGISGLYLSQESKTDPFDITGNLCNVCCLKPKNGLFCHEKSSHNYSCYPCSKKIWRKSGKCPICNITIKYVTKVYY